MSTRDRYVVARMASGLVLRGTTVDFTPERPTFWVTPDGCGRGVEVRLADLKALFFPRHEPGSESETPTAYAPAPDPTRDGKRLVVRFMDGETMTGYALSYRPEKPGFFLFPDDPESQHEKIFVLQTATSDVLAGPHAQAHPIASRSPGPTVQKKVA
ncbi:MAG: hypothetical protein SGI90_11975 [Candidatus Eisenbacteria bacterium]|nr:hypothetical protein [Candidatus Eisenbacteria bacterium]